MTVMEFDDDGKLGEYCSGIIESLIDKNISAGKEFSLALSGGGSPLSTYAGLSGKNIDWKKVFIFLADERYVGHDDINSNFRMIKQALLERAGIPVQNIIAPDTGLPDPEQSASEYERALRRHFNPSGIGYGTPSFDLVCLGIGDDGHTASLFPGGKALSEKEKLVANTYAPDDFPVKARITFTLPLINNAKNVFFIVSGKNKGGIIAGVLSDDKRLPASRVKPSGELILFINKLSLG